MIFTDKLYYIIRIGDFATNANTKLYYSAFTTLLCLDDYFYNQSITTLARDASEINKAPHFLLLGLIFRHHYLLVSYTTEGWHAS